MVKGGRLGGWAVGRSAGEGPSASAQPPNRPTAQPPSRLLVSCPDRPGIVSAVSSFLFENGANLMHADQHTTAREPRRFFLRAEFEGPTAAALEPLFAPVAAAWGMEARFVDAARPKRLAIFATKEAHCLRELLTGVESGDLDAEIVAVVANHDDLRPVAESHAAPFHWVPTGPDAETEMIRLAGDADAIVLAKFMRILSPGFLAAAGRPVINIHHSFLPAFVGASPYRQAWERGVKLIGATAHFVTEELDAGPIIEQDVARVDHRREPADLRRLGARVEREVLARAVAWWCEDRVIVDGGKTVVFPG